MRHTTTIKSPEDLYPITISDIFIRIWEIEEKYKIALLAPVMSLKFPFISSIKVSKIRWERDLVIK